MAEQIALLLQQHFIEYCRPILGDAQGSCQLTYLQYGSIAELQTLFLQNKEKFDAFLVSGTIPMNALKAVDTAPYSLIRYFGSYLENTYRILLVHILERGCPDSARIGIDYLDQGQDLQTVLRQDSLPKLLSEFEQAADGLSGEALVDFEHHLVERYIRQHREGRLDFVVSSFYSVVRALKEKGLECYYAYPSSNSIVQTLELCSKDIRIRKMRGNASAVIRVCPVLQEIVTANDQELTMLALKSRILEYCRSYRCVPILKDDFSDIEVYISKEQLEQMTEHFSSFGLPNDLKKNAGFKGVISIGIGDNLSAAKMNAVQAKAYSLRTDQTPCICIDEQGNIRSVPTGPERKTPVPSISDRYIETAANRCHLSSETVYRVFSAALSKPSPCLTSAELMQDQGFSSRMATKVLKALADSGYAEIIGQKRIGNKGRPQNLFRLSLPEPSPTSGAEE